MEDIQEISEKFVGGVIFPEYIPWLEAERSVSYFCEGDS